MRSWQSLAHGVGAVLGEAVARGEVGAARAWGSGTMSSGQREVDAEDLVEERDAALDGVALVARGVSGEEARLREDAGALAGVERGGLRLVALHLDVVELAQARAR
jgi:hypothetical protein